MTLDHLFQWVASFTGVPLLRLPSVCGHELSVFAALAHVLLSQGAHKHFSTSISSRPNLASSLIFLNLEERLQKRDA